MSLLSRRFIDHGPDAALRRPNIVRCRKWRLHHFAPNCSGLQPRAGRVSLSRPPGPVGNGKPEPGSSSSLKFRTVGSNRTFAWQLALTAIARFIGWLVLLSALFGLAASGVRGSETPSARAPARLTREYDLKAAFLFNFSQFVAWPEQAFAQTNSPFVIVLLGDDPFGKSLDQIVANELVRGHRIVVRRYRDVQQVKECHILYISPSETPRLDSIFKALQGRNILAVGEANDFAAHGGAIRFLLQENKLRLKVNVEATKAAKLTISSKLLRQADILEPSGPEPGR